MKTFKEIVNTINEVKEVPIKNVMKKIKDGEWEAESDVVAGKLVSIRTFTGKKMMIRVER